MKDGEGSFVLKPVTFHRSDSLWEQLVQMSFSWDSRKEERWALQETPWPSPPLTNHSPLPKSWLSREEVRPQATAEVTGGCRCLVSFITNYMSNPEELPQQQSPGGLCPEMEKLWIPHKQADQERRCHSALSPEHPGRNVAVSNYTVVWVSRTDSPLGIRQLWGSMSWYFGAWKKEAEGERQLSTLKVESSLATYYANLANYWPLCLSFFIWKRGII